MRLIDAKKTTLFSAIAVCLLAGAAHAQTTEPQSGMAGGLEVSTIKPRPSQPTISSSIEGLENQIAPQKREEVQVDLDKPIFPGLTQSLDELASTALTEKSPDVPWVLDSKTMPLPMHYSAPSHPRALYFSIPEARDIRLMPPGLAKEQIAMVRSHTEKYARELIAEATLKRKQQLDAATAWVQDSLQKETLLDATDPWVKYQFTKTGRASALEFRAQIEGQSERLTVMVADDIKVAVEAVTPVMDNVVDYEQKMGWYNVLVQLRDALELYQVQTIDADSAILAMMDSWLDSHPEVLPPAGPLPLTPEQREQVAARAQLAPEGVPSLAQQVEQQTRVPAQAVPGTQEAQGASGVAKVFVFIGGLALVAVLYIRSRRKSKKMIAPTE